MIFLCQSRISLISKASWTTRLCELSNPPPLADLGNHKTDGLSKSLPTRLRNLAPRAIPSSEFIEDPRSRFRLCRRQTLSLPHLHDVTLVFGTRRSTSKLRRAISSQRNIVTTGPPCLLFVPVTATLDRAYGAFRRIVNCLHISSR